MTPQRDVAAIVLAAGSGARFGGPKQFTRAGTARLVDLAIDCLAPVAATIVVVVPPETRWNGAGTAVAGGATRSESVRNGLARVPVDAAIVVVHDAAHPLARTHLVEALVRAVRDGADGAVPVLATRETVAYTDGNDLGAAVPRAGLVQVQMPHAFRTSLLRAAHTSATSATDDATLFQELGHRVVTVDGDPRNIHVTTPAELELIRRIRESERRLP